MILSLYANTTLLRTKFRIEISLFTLHGLFLFGNHLEYANSSIQIFTIVIVHKYFRSNYFAIDYRQYHI